MTNRPLVGKRRFRAIWLVPALFLMALTGWAVSSPAGSSPDDDFHLASIWCGLGDRPGLCEATGDNTSRLIPQAITTSAGCYAYHPEQSAACLVDHTGAPVLVEATRGNFGHLYPPVFYAAAGLFASSDVSASAIVVRVVNSVLLLALAATLYLLLPVIRRPALVWGLLVSVIPLGLFIVASDNPSSWAVISAGTLWLALVGYFESRGRRRIGLGAIAALATVLGAGSRADSAAYSGLAIVVAIILTARHTRQYLLAALLPVALAAVSVAFYLSADQGASAAGGLVSNQAGTNPFILFAYNLLNVPALWVGVFGSYGLGWLDTVMPAYVSIGALFVFVGLIFASLRYLSWRKTASILLILLALVAIPSYVLTQSNSIVGAQVQPRYILPLIVMLAGVAFFRIDDRALRLSFGQRYFVAGLLATTQAIALHFNFRRYLTGLDVGNWNLNDHVEWWWGGPFSPMLVWAVASLAFAAAVLLVVRELDPMASRRVPVGMVPAPAGVASTD